VAKSRVVGPYKNKVAYMNLLIMLINIVNVIIQINAHDEHVVAAYARQSAFETYTRLT